MKRSFITGVIFILLVLLMIQPAEVRQVMVYESESEPVSESEDYAVHSANRSVKRTEKPVYIDECTNIQDEEPYDSLDFCRVARRHSI